MTPRPRTIPDEDILEATGRIIGRLGPSRFTLADVAAEVGLAPATLVQRFGSKRGLMLALAESNASGIDQGFAAIRAATDSPLDALLIAATHMAGMVESPESLGNHLAFLQIDLSDPEFHALALQSARALRAGYRTLLDEAIATGELAPLDSPRMARAVEAVAGGSLIAWAIHRDGDVAALVRQDVETLLAPHRRAPGAEKGGAPTARGARRPAAASRRR